MTKPQYKTPKFEKYFVEILGWIFLIGIPAGIWINEYRWKLIWTSLFAIFIGSIIAIVDNINENKFNEELAKEKN